MSQGVIPPARSRPPTPRAGRMTPQFAPFEELAQALWPHGLEPGDDGAHDAAHLLRVWRNVCAIQAQEGGDLRCLVAATLLHDCVSVEKNHPDRSRASTMAAEKARGILRGLDWCVGDIDVVCHAIEAHSHSAHIPAQSIEAKVLQDADRLDAIGLIGVARCFYTGGRMGSSLYEPADPKAQARDLEDARYALDHFEVKLLRLADGFQTRTGRQMARARHDKLVHFRDDLLAELDGRA